MAERSKPGTVRGAKGEAHDFIVAHTHDTADEAAHVWVRDFYRKPLRSRLIGFGVAAALGLVGVVIANTSHAGGAQIVLASWIVTFVLFVAVVMLFMALSTRRGIFPKMLGFLDSDFDPRAFCDCYLAYLEVSDSKDLTTTIHNYCRGLRWQGRSKDAESLFTAYLEAYGLTDDEQCDQLLHQLRASIAFDRQRLAEMDREMAQLADAEMSPQLRESANQLAVLEQLLALEREERTEEAAELAERVFASSASVLKVAMALHRAMDSTWREDGLEWLELTIKMGGTTWCERRAKALRSSGQIQRLPRRPKQDEA